MLKKNIEIRKANGNSIKNYSVTLLKILMMLLFISYSELFVVFFVVLLVFGPEKLPEIARNLGKGIRQLRDTTNNVKNEMLKETQKAGLDTEAIEKLKKDLKNTKKIMNIKEEVTNTIKRS